MKVFVVMGNDFPETVFSKLADANAFCAAKKSADKGQHRKIYWRVYEFELDGSGK